MSKKACEANIDELDFLSVEQALAYCHMGEMTFNERVRPHVNTYPSTTYYKKELRDWMIANVQIMRKR